MKKTTVWIAGCFVAAGISVFSVSQARAAHPDLNTTTAGALTFFAVAEVESPTPGQIVGSPHTFVNNPTTPIDNRNHKVKITGPANTGNINIDYALSFDYDMSVVGSTNIVNVLVGLDGFGLWIFRPVYSQSLSVAVGPHTASSASVIKFRPGGQIASIGHGHNFTR